MKRIGSFQVKSGNICVSDPCYQNDGIFKTGARNGTWVADIELSDEGSWGTRVASLHARHKDFPHPVNLEKGPRLDVDTGMMGIYDAEEFHSDDPVWYDMVCEVNDAMIIDGGVVSSSGFGDGEYPTHVSRDKAGRAVSVLVVFIDEDEDR